MSGRRRKILPSSKGKRGKREWGVKIMGPTQSALFRTFCHVWRERSPNYLGVCAHPLAHPSASPPLPLLPPLQRCLPQRTAGSSRISSAALLHIAPITDYSLLPLLLDLKFGEVEKHHFSLLSSVSNMMLAGSVCCTWHSFSSNETLLEYRSVEIRLQPSAHQNA